MGVGGSWYYGAVGTGQKDADHEGIEEQQVDHHQQVGHSYCPAGGVWGAELCYSEAGNKEAKKMTNLLDLLSDACSECVYVAKLS